VLYDDANRAQRLMRRLPKIGWVSRASARIAPPIDKRVYRLTKGRRTLTSMSTGLPVVVLETTGARSGQPRRGPVLGIPDGEDVVVLASNFGLAKHPAWYHNLRAHPRAAITVDGTRHEVVARIAEGEERERLWRRGLEFYPAWTQYQRRAGDREIPVVVLSPASVGA
jgi:deazaflavin-dependent oxidoreductase (nitroreductase family)